MRELWFGSVCGHNCLPYIYYTIPYSWSHLLPRHFNSIPSLSVVLRLSLCLTCKGKGRQSRQVYMPLYTTCFSLEAWRSHPYSDLTKHYSHDMWLQYDYITGHAAFLACRTQVLYHLYMHTVLYLSALLSQSCDIRFSFKGMLLCSGPMYAHTWSYHTM